MSKVTKTVEQIALPIVKELGLEIVDIEYVKEGKIGTFVCSSIETGVDRGLWHRQ